jgi:hypothetical protein
MDGTTLNLPVCQMAQGSIRKAILDQAMQAQQESVILLLK